MFSSMGCAGFGGLRSRRDFLRVGVVGAASITLGDYLRAGGGVKPAKAQAVIQIFLQGGFPHMDSFDPKPDAPAEYRGVLKPVATRTPGIQFSEHLARTAKLSDQLAVIRSITHTEVDHGRGEHNMLTGYRPSPALVYPSLGTIASQELGPRAELPAYIAVPQATSQYMGSGYLSSAHGPFALGADPSRPGFQVRDLSLPSGIDQARFEKRKSMRAMVDEHFSAMEKADVLDAMDSFYQRAYSMLASPKAREAFNLKSETKESLALYGIGGPRGQDAASIARASAGPRFLLCRRLVEAGARFVTMTYGRWDTHAFHYRSIEPQMPAFDSGLAALLTDLKQRGMLDSTLVLVTSEFGRTPRINSGGGRDHWPRVFSVVMAGGGIRGGMVLGSSDALAGEPKDRPVAVEDFAATIHCLLGIDHGKELMAPGNRPVQIMQNGQPIKELVS
jgi:Protein of unknown function (DUF1501)